MNFAYRLKQARIEAGLTQAEVSELLSRTGLSVKAYAISSWETGKHRPDLEQFALLCGVYSADPMFLLTGSAGQAGGGLLSGLNRNGRAQAHNYLSLLKSDPRYSDSVDIAGTVTVRLYSIPVSAGTGVDLQDCDYEELSCSSPLPRGTDYALRVSGDSMEPRFIHGQIICVKEQQSLNDGEIGIFLLNGEAYVKKYQSGTLVSLNPKYRPIVLREPDDFRILGRVVGTL